MKIAREKKLGRRLTAVGLILVVIGASAFALWSFMHQQTASPPVVTPAKTTSKPVEKQSLLLPGAKTAIPLPIDTTLLARPDGQLILVNKKTPIDLAYTPTDLVIPDVPYRTDKAIEEIMVRNALAKPLHNMFAAAKAVNIELMIGSAYRSSALQEKYFNSYVSASGLAEAEKFSAHPGTSEHQLGLAVDLTTTDRKCYLVECFESTPAGQWLAANAHTYGFILRYMKNKTDVTNYNYEPWHFRYVGVDVATAIYESGLAYEEVFPYLSGEKQP